MLKRVTEILYEMAANEGFYFLDIERFCKKNKEEIQNLNTIFNADNDARNDEIMDVAHYLISKTFDGFDDYEKPDNFDDDKLLVLAGLIENQSFFSMCWNYMQLEKHKVNIVPKRKEENKSFIFSLNNYWEKQINKEVFVPAAGKSGFNNLTAIEIDGIGSLKVLGNEETKRMYFAVTLNKDVRSRRFEIAVRFKICNEEKIVLIVKDYNDEETDISSDPIPIDFSVGFKIMNISYKPL